MIWVFEEQGKIQPIATLAKAEILATKLKDDDSQILKNPSGEDFTKVGTLTGANIDWRLEIIPGWESPANSQTKLKICELATGNKFTEEWTFVPENCKHGLRVAIKDLQENFALVFKGDEILLLNLATRKQFSVRTDNIINQMKAKAPVHPEVNALNIDIKSRIGSGISGMQIGSNKIEILYTALMNYGTVDLGSFYCHHIQISTLFKYVQSINFQRLHFGVFTG